MIQRIQTVYLVVAVALLAVAMCLPVAALSPVEDLSKEFVLMNWGSEANGVCRFIWVLMCLLLLSAVCMMWAIFLYKKRPLQMRISRLGGAILVVYYILLVAAIFSDTNYSYTLEVGSFLPVLSVALAWMAAHSIKKDEMLVRAADRLR